jgi:hypothetical protein
MYEKNSRKHLSRLENKYKNCEGTKYNPSFGQNRDYRKNWIRHVNRKPRKRLPSLLKPTQKRQEEPGEITEETYGGPTP